jgi:internalin A
LTELNIGGAQVAGLQRLQDVASLKKLMIMEQVNLDLSPVGDLHSLENLWILSPPQLDVSPLPNLTKLHDLSILGGLGILRGPTSVTNVEVMGELAEQRTLTLGFLQIADLAFAKKLRGLSEININHLPIQSVEPLRDLKSLTKISLTGTLVVDVSPLLDLPALTELRITQTPARADVLTELQQRGVTINR